MIASMKALRGRDFLDIADLDADELREVLDLAHTIKKAGRWPGRPLDGRHIAMLFQKPSHRTRVSFEVGIARLGGRATALSEQDVQIGVRETVGDAARVLDRYVDGVVARLRNHSDLLDLAASSTKPVINALTDRSHPCQVLADLVTLEQVKGELPKQHLVYVGDGNNIAASLIEASALTGLALTVISPPGYEPKTDVVDRARRISTGKLQLTLTSDIAALEDATAIYTDVWASMGHESEMDTRRKAFAPYQVNEALLKAAPGAVFMHCLPAHRGDEVTDEVMDGARSVVFDQAENRLYAQMALMTLLLGAGE